MKLNFRAQELTHELRITVHQLQQYAAQTDDQTKAKKGRGSQGEALICKRTETSPLKENKSGLLHRKSANQIGVCADLDHITVPVPTKNRLSLLGSKEAESTIDDGQGVTTQKAGIPGFARSRDPYASPSVVSQEDREESAVPVDTRKVLNARRRELKDEEPQVQHNAMKRLKAAFADG